MNHLEPNSENNEDDYYMKLPEVYLGICGDVFFYKNS